VENLIVGRTPYCDSVNPNVPVVGDLMNVDFERLVRVNPTVVLVQPPGGTMDPVLEEVAAQHGWRLQGWHLDRIADIIGLVEQLPNAIWAENAQSSPVCQAANAKADELVGRIKALQSPDADPAHWRGKTLIVHGTESIVVYGRRTYLDELLTALGGTNATDAEGWVQLSVEDVVRLDPEAILLVRPGEPADADPMELLGQLKSLNIKAVKDHRVAVLRDRDILLPSSAVLAAADELRAILREFNKADPP